jgi:hypothetical protein
LLRRGGATGMLDWFLRVSYSFCSRLSWTEPEHSVPPFCFWNQEELTDHAKISNYCILIDGL